MAKGKKTGGRVAGTPNKDVLPILAIFEELEYEPAVEAIKVLKSGALDPDVAINAHLKMMKFKYAERKAVDVTVDDPGRDDAVKNALEALLKHKE